MFTHSLKWVFSGIISGEKEVVVGDIERELMCPGVPVAGRYGFDDEGTIMILCIWPAVRLKSTSLTRDSRSG